MLMSGSDTPVTKTYAELIVFVLLTRTGTRTAACFPDSSPLCRLRPAKLSRFVGRAQTLAGIADHCSGIVLLVPYQSFGGFSQQVTTQGFMLICRL